MSTDLAVTKAKDYAITAADSESIKADIAKNAGSDLNEFMFKRVKIPSGGVTVWTIPSSDGDKHLEYIDCIVVDFRDVRVYYASDEMTNTPPDCHSSDGLTGVGNPGGVCSSCEFSQFGSGRGGGKACRQRRILFAIEPDSILPTVVDLATTSFLACQKYFFELINEKKNWSQYILRLGLKKVAGEPDYSVITFKRMDELSAAEVKKIKGLAESLRPQLKQVAVVDLDTGEVT